MTLRAAGAGGCRKGAAKRESERPSEICSRAFPLERTRGAPHLTGAIGGKPNRAYIKMVFQEIFYKTGSDLQASIYKDWKAARQKAEKGRNVSP